MLKFNTEIIFCLLLTVLFAPKLVVAGGYDSTSDVNNFMANGNMVMTLTGSTINADFLGSVTVDGTFYSAGVLSAAAGMNVNNKSIFYPNGSASFAGSVWIGTASPAGTLDVEDSNGTATFCLNGACVSSLSQLNGSAGATGPQGPAGPQGTTGPQGPQGDPAGVPSGTLCGQATGSILSSGWSYHTNITCQGYDVGSGSCPGGYRSVSGFGDRWCAKN